MAKLRQLILFFIIFFWGIFLLNNACTACSWSMNIGTVDSPYDDSDMAACVADAATKSGAIVILIPNCDVTWDAIIPINMTNWTNVTSLTIQGASKTGTVITNSSWAVTTKTNRKFRLTNLTAKGKVLGSNGAAVLVKGDTKPSLGGGFRIDNIIFDSDIDPNGRAIFIFGDTYGLIDNIDSNWYGQFSIVYTGIANLSWSTDDSFGTADAVYLENSKLTNKQPSYQNMVMDHWDGARVVVRYNNISGYYFGGHDNIGTIRANRHWEVYNNIMYTNSSYGSPLLGDRGGTGYIYNNQMISTGAYPFYGPTSGITLTNYRSWSKRDTWCDNITEKICVSGTVKNCSSDADCGGISGACQPVDGNIDGTGYPCRDQIGMGKNQTSRPALFWNNTLKIQNNLPVLVNAMVNNNCVSDSSETLCNPLAIASGDARWMANNHIKENRDFCNGATIPLSCNGLETTYAAYACPHPLTGLTGSCDPTLAGTLGYNVNISDTTPPSAPSGLVVN
ncbi:MAG: hypothetical protein WCV70_04245 [Patescibacteria group bacterium]